MEEEIKAAVVAGLGSQKSKMVMMMKLVKFESHQAVGSEEHYSMKISVVLGLLSCC